ncbi:hypothetical protein [Falsibacillus pallidus]|uniref:Uncharacterized protein n=1 Tax=Falsibacillus pallidus TaxID=493781 RepID=A0A370GVM8_9BACI|nr:hypothetical protein [Falsibacillus pallidus]RDI47735.1 hypothetical protein DFR59_101398 [Falsibacillus pallidus]
MGYIAPIPHYQYKQYQERVTSKQYDPFFLQPITKVTPTAAFEIDKDLPENQEAKKRKQSDSYAAAVPKTKNKNRMLNDFYPYTGKGKYINEVI